MRLASMLHHKMTRTFCLHVALIVLLVSVSESQVSEVKDSETEPFEHDLIFWALKKRMFFVHKTYAYYTDPRDINTTTGGDLEKTLLFESLWNGEIWTMASDYHAKRIYYSDHAGNFIGVYDLKTKEHMKLFQGMAWGIDSISVDWVSGNVYWADSNFKWIMVANRNFSYYRNLFAIDSDIPAKVAVHPIDRYLYWTEKRKSDCRIWRSDLEGYSHELLHTFSEVQTISDVAIDFVNHRFYWAERLKERGGISRIRYFGIRTRREFNEVHEIYRANSSYLFGIASYKDNLYVTDDLRKSMFVINKATNEVKHSYAFQYSEIPRGIAVYSEYEQPLSEKDKAHECSKSPCEHICLAKYGNNQFSCECSTGFRIQADGKSCKVDMIFDDFAILLDGKHSKLFQLNMGSPVEPQQIQVDGVKMPTSSAFDPQTNTVYWADEKTRTVSSADLYGDHQKTLVKNAQVYSIALDVGAGNIYWVDSEKDAMFVARMDGSYPHMLHVNDLHRVWAMTLDTGRGFIYWSDWGQIAHDGSQHGVIESSRMDGTERRVLVKNAASPHGLTLDVKGNVLYWTEIKLNAIGWMNLNDQTMGIYKLPKSKKRAFPTGIAFYQNYIYVSDMSVKHLIRVSAADVTKMTNRTENAEEVRKFGPGMFFQLSAISVYDSTTRNKERSTCADSTCPHLCLPVYSSEPISYKCVCQNHFQYHEHDNKCVQITSAVDDEKPTFGETCPSDAVIYADECSQEAKVDFTPPTATDNSRLPVYIRSTYTRQPPLNLTEGSYNFAYTAMDKSGNKATCQFRIQIIVRTCYDISLKFTTPNDAVLSKPSCGNNVGSVINVTCPGIPGIAFQYQCQANLAWNSMGIETCESQPTAQKPTLLVTYSAISTTVPASVFPDTTETVSKSSTSTFINVSDSDKHEAGRKTTSSSFIDASDSGKHEAGGTSSSSTGLVVGIVIAIIILIAILVAAFIVMRRKGKKMIPGTNWRRTGDRVHLTGASTESGIYLGDNQDQELPVMSSSEHLVL